MSEVRELHRVPGEWHCLLCQRRVSTAPDVTERPACPEGCNVPCVPLSWKRYGPEQQLHLATERERLEAALARGFTLADRCDELRQMVDEGQAREAALLAERDVALKTFQEEQGITTALRAQVVATWHALRWSTAAAAILGACAGAWICSLAR